MSTSSTYAGEAEHDDAATAPGFPGITHVAVTVSDLERSTRWYSALFDAPPVLDEDENIGGFHHTVFALGGGQLFGLHTHAFGPGGRFDERRPGLDHVAFACRDRAELQGWARRLEPSRRPARRASSTPTTARGCRSAIRTASPWSSSPHRPDHGRHRSDRPSARAALRGPARVSAARVVVVAVGNCRQLLEPVGLVAAIGRGVVVGRERPVVG